MHRISLALAAILIMTAGVIPATATNISQLWNLDTNSVNTIELFLVTPSATFPTPAITGLPGGWIVSQPNDQYTLATGGPGNAGMNYTINIESSVASFALDVLEWDGTVLQEEMRYFYNPATTSGFTSNVGLWYWSQPPAGGFVDPSLEGTPHDQSQVPEPTTIALFGLGLFGLAAIRHRRQH